MGISKASKVLRDLKLNLLRVWLFQSQSRYYTTVLYSLWGVHWVTKCKQIFLSKRSILFPPCHTDVLCDTMKAETCLTWSVPGTTPETNPMKLAVLFLHVTNEKSRHRFKGTIFNFQILFVIYFIIAEGYFISERLIKTVHKVADVRSSSHVEAPQIRWWRFWSFYCLNSFPVSSTALFFCVCSIQERKTVGPFQTSRRLSSKTKYRSR